MVLPGWKDQDELRLASLTAFLRLWCMEYRMEAVRQTTITASDTNIEILMSKYSSSIFTPMKASTPAIPC